MIDNCLAANQKISSFENERCNYLLLLREAPPQHSQQLQTKGFIGGAVKH